MGQAAIFAGNYVKLLKDQLKFKDTLRILTDSSDPTSVAHDAEISSLYLREGTPGLYIKQDNGSTTNWISIHPGFINTDLLPTVDNYYNIGSDALSWKDLWIDGAMYLDGQRVLHNGNNLSSGIYIGRGAGNFTASGLGNTAVGYQSLQASTTCANSTALGDSALYSNLSGHRNVAIGKDALYTNTIGTDNVGVGYQASYLSVSCQGTVAVGYQALYSVSATNYCVAIGRSAARNTTTGYYNVAIGAFSLYSNQANEKSVAIGHNAMYYADDRSSGREVGSIAIGYEALYGSTTAANNTGRWNTAIGMNSLRVNTSGDANISVGYNALNLNTTGSYNIAIGNSALSANQTGIGNIGIGDSSGPTTNALSYLITIGRSVTSGVGNRILIGNSADYTNGVLIPRVYTDTTAIPSNMYVDTDGRLWRSTFAGAAIVKAKYLDVSSTILPTGIPFAPDGTNVVDGDRVLFTNLTSDNNRIYQATVVAGNVTTWTVQVMFNGANDPSDGDFTVIQDGSYYANNLLEFDGSNWFNLINRKSSTTLLDNTVNGIAFQVLASDIKFISLEYSIVRGTSTRIGNLLVTHNGVTSSIIDTGTESASTGITFSAVLDSGYIRILYTTTNTGSNATWKNSVRAWS